MLDNIPEFDKVFTRKTPEEVGVMLDEYLSSEDQTEDSSVETVYTSNSENVSEVDSAFKDLLSS
jgi:archaellum biogenesis protein FlaJ (TadC family)